MDNLFLAVLMFTINGVMMSEDCWIPCTNLEGGSCVSIRCNTITKATFECNIISTVMSSSSKLQTSPQSCISPNDVPGIPQYCSHLLRNGSSRLENLHEAITSKPTKPLYTEEDVTTASGSDCIPTTVLAGVAVGCFLTGAVAMWFFLLVLWSKKHPLCCHHSSKKMSIATLVDHRLPATPSATRHNVPPARVISVSHQRLLSSTSVDSGMSSTQMTTPQSPPVTSVLPVTETTDIVLTDTNGHYTRLSRDSNAVHTTQNLDRNNPNSDYASLLSGELSARTNIGTSLYQDLQSTGGSEASWSNDLSQSLTNQRTNQSKPDECITYPSMTRSTKSDTHDYESIFNGSTSAASVVVDTDYKDFGSCKGSDYDYHEYHLCGASSSLENHDYFILEKQSSDYLVLDQNP